MKNYQKVRSRFADEQSRIIYDNRLNFSMTGNQRQIWQMLEQIDGFRNIANLKKRLNRYAHKKLVIFGAGYNGMFIRECLAEYNWIAVQPFF